MKLSEGGSCVNIYITGKFMYEDFLWELIFIFLFEGNSCVKLAGGQLMRGGHNVISAPERNRGERN